MDSRRQLFQLFFDGKFRWPTKEIVENILEHISKERTIARPLRQKVHNFVVQLKKKWAAAGRQRKLFLKNNELWLDQPLLKSGNKGGIEEAENSEKQSIEPQPGTSTGLSIRRRPLREFQEVSESQKRRRTKALRESNLDELVFATASTLRKEKKIEAANVLTEAVSSPDRAKKMMSAYQQPQWEPYSEKEAVALLIKCQLTKRQYQLLRNSSRQKGVNLYPSYEKILAYKKCCYPESIVVTDVEAKVSLQHLLDSTAAKILKSIDISKFEGTLLVKWGMDGSSGHSEFKIRLREGESDATMFTTALVPLQLATNEGDIIWRNETPASPNLCRPLRMAFEKETTDSITKEYSRIQNETQQLFPFSIGEKTIKYNMVLTMIDGKVLNAVTGNKSTSSCAICGSKSKELSHPPKVPCDIRQLVFGISPLHCRIKTFEFLLRLSYRLDPVLIKKQKGSRRTAEEKEIEQRRKSDIQKKFKEQVGLNIDIPKPGFGTSHDGNTARRFFADISKTASITNLPEEILQRFANILTAISIYEQLNIEKYEKYAYETAQEYNKQFDWWPMSPTVHKLIYHGGHILRNSEVALGILSEEPLEARNKDFKRYRLDFARRMNRKKNLEDIFNRFLISSDPEISLTFREGKKKTYRILPSEVQEMLKYPNISATETQRDIQVDTDTPSETDIDHTDSESEIDSISGSEAEISDSEGSLVEVEKP